MTAPRLRFGWTHGLLAAAVALFVVFFGLSMHRLFAIEQDVAADFGENLVLSMAQNEKMTLAFLDELHRFARGAPDATKETLTRRFDLLWSRVSVVRTGELAARLEAVPGGVETMTRTRVALEEVEPMVEALEPGETALAGEIDARLRPLLPELARATFAATHADLARLTARGEARRNAILGAVATMSAVLVSVSIIVALLVHELFHHNRLTALAVDAERAARESETRLGDVLDAASEWVWETDAAGRLVFVSGHTRRLSGLEPSQLLGRTFEELHLVGEDDPGWARVKGMIRAGHAFRDLVFPYRDAEGERRWLRLHGKPVCGAGGTITGWRGTGADVTAEHEAEAQAEKSRRLIRAIIDAVPALINVKDRDSRYVFMNAYQGSVYGVAPQEAVGRTSEEFTGDEYGHGSRRLDLEVIESGRPQPFSEREFVGPDGRKRIWWTSKSPLTGEDGSVQHVVTVALDITALKAAESARRNLSRYFSPNIVGLLAARDDAIASQAHDSTVAVLFADLRDFTRIASHEPPATVLALLREFHVRMTEAVLDANGTLEKYLGDGLMATFGTPFTTERDATNALLAARRMLDALAAWNAERRTGGAAPVEMGIGIHYGPVILGEIGTRERAEYAVVGDTVNLASRLQTLTRGLDAAVAVSAHFASRVVAENAGGTDALAAFTPPRAELVDGYDLPVQVRVLPREAASRAPPATGAGSTAANEP